MNLIGVLLGKLARSAWAARGLRTAWARRSGLAPVPGGAWAAGSSMLAAQESRSVEQQIACKKVIGYCREVLGDRSR